MMKYNNCSSWRYYSWKTKCCVKFHFYYQGGKKGEKVLCADVKDLRYEMKEWGNLKYGWQDPWKNVYKAVLYCQDGENYTDNNKNTNYDNENHNDNKNDYK